MTDPSRDALREALKRTAAAFKATDVPFALAGSYALWVYGAPESSHDVDFVVAEDDAAAARRALADGGLEVEQPPEDWLFKLHTDGVVVDVFHRSAGTPVTREEIERATWTDVLSLHMPVLDPTDVLRGKLRALTEHYCDFEPLLAAVRAVRERVDWDRLREEVADNDFAVAFLFLTDRLGITPS